MTFDFGFAPPPGEEVCDFCCTDSTTWTYDCKDFIFEEVNIAGVGNIFNGSKGAWAACTPCHKLIERGDIPGLITYTDKHFYEQHPELVELLSRDERRELRKARIKIIKGFFKNRIGPAIKSVDWKGGY